MNFAEKAQYYRTALGWPVFPVSRTKKPLTTHGFKDATLDHDQIDVWSDEFPDANIATPTGRGTDIIVIDIDGEEGRANARRIAIERGWRLPPTAWAKTSRGWHLYYRWMPNVKSSAGKIAPGIDVRSDGGSIILPPSIHASGAVYTWKARPDETNMPLVPLWVVRGRAEKPAPPRIERDVDLSKWADEVSRAPEGQRNHTLNRAAYVCGLMVRDGRAREADVRQMLSSAGLACGLHKIEIERTITSGLKSGQHAHSTTRR